MKEILMFLAQRKWCYWQELSYNFSKSEIDEVYEKGLIDNYNNDPNKFMLTDLGLSVWEDRQRIMALIKKKEEHNERLLRS